MRLSIVIPCFNEVGTIDAVLEAVRGVALPVEREIVVVDDFSKDGTRERLAALEKTEHDLRVIYQPENRGKGAALRAGFAAATGDIILIQDADLECDPEDYPKLLAPILEDKASVVYGSRFIRTAEAHRVLSYRRSLANRFLTSLCNLFTDLDLSDMEVCYKVFKRGLLDRIVLTEDRFGFEPEFTIQMARTGCTVYEVAVSYHPRSEAQGKKIRWKDGVRAVYVILKHGLRKSGKAPGA